MHYLGTILIAVGSAAAGAIILAICSAAVTREDEGRAHFLVRIFIQGYAAVVLRILVEKTSEQGIEKKLYKWRRNLQKWYEFRDEARNELEADPENSEKQHRFEFEERILRRTQCFTDYLFGLAFLGGYGKVATKVLKQKIS